MIHRFDESPEYRELTLEEVKKISKKIDLAFENIANETPPWLKIFPSPECRRDEGVVAVEISGIYIFSEKFFVDVSSFRMQKVQLTLVHAYGTYRARLVAVAEGRGASVAPADTNEQEMYKEVLAIYEKMEKAKEGFFNIRDHKNKCEAHYSLSQLLS